jgi:hypothetical protein
MRTIKQQKKAIRKFTEELALLEKKYRVYVDGWHVTGNFRDYVGTKNSWELDDDERDDDD